ncbi:MAG: prolipoprotein diacylglyceryl transferase [Planctomycetes bacterium]|nr:prolipoprotein diacylglyceryl transferase [Planctomycetota bacterium]
MWQTLFYIPILNRPVYGFGLMLFVGFVAATSLALRRARREGFDRKRTEDAALVILLGGIVGSRLFFVLQYAPEFFKPPLGTTLTALGASAALLTALSVLVWSVAHKRLRLRRAALLGGLAGSSGLILLRSPSANFGPLPLLLLWSALFVWLAASIARSMDPKLATLVSAGSAVIFALALGALELLDGWTAGELGRTALKLFNLSQGGLVWYGGVLGAVAAFLGFVFKTKVPGLRFSDLLAPSVVLGLAFGRVGCFLNGCCYGDPTTLPWAVYFPPHSPAYERHLSEQRISPRYRTSLGVHPTQLYSALNALLLVAVLLAYYPLRRRDGEVIGLLLVLYAPTRFLIEFLRADEPAQWGTGLTISQNLSIVAFAAGLLWMLWLRRRRPAQQAMPSSPGPAHRAAKQFEP